MPRGSGNEAGEPFLKQDTRREFHLTRELESCRFSGASRLHIVIIDRDLENGVASA
jgi:hypothetical protein